MFRNHQTLLLNFSRYVSVRNDGYHKDDTIRNLNKGHPKDESGAIIFKRLSVFTLVVLFGGEWVFGMIADLWQYRVKIFYNLLNTVA